MVEVLDALEEGTASATPQPAEGVSLAPKISVEEGRIDFREPAAAIDRRIRAVTPAPGAWTTGTDGARVKLEPLAAEGSAPRAAGVESGELAPGELRAEKHRVLVGTGDGAVVLGRVAPAGKSWMEAAAWARGARLEAGARWGTTNDDTQGAQR